MSTQKFRWSKVYESAESELIEFLKHRKLAGDRIAKDAFAEPVEFAESAESQSADAPNQYPQVVTLWCAEGSMTVRVGTNNISIQPGDALRIDKQVPFTIAAGISGYVYYRTLQD